jgi:hypothetical protein
VTAPGKLLRAIRLDPSDTFVFERVAEPGEWAVPGTFVFMGTDPKTLQGKARVAFRSGFLGLDSLGWSTLVQIVAASEADRAAAVELLAQKLISDFGAPELAVARAAAEEEIAFAQSLCDQAESTIIAMHRIDDDGAIRETFRTLRPQEGQRPARAFSFLEVEGEGDDEAAADEVDLVGLAKRNASKVP